MDSSLAARTRRRVLRRPPLLAAGETRDLYARLWWARAGHGREQDDGEGKSREARAPAAHAATRDMARSALPCCCYAPVWLPLSEILAILFGVSPDSVDGLTA